VKGLKLERETLFCRGEAFLLLMREKEKNVGPFLKGRGVGKDPITCGVVILSQGKKEKEKCRAYRLTYEPTEKKGRGKKRGREKNKTSHEIRGESSCNSLIRKGGEKKKKKRRTEPDPGTIIQDTEGKKNHPVLGPANHPWETLLIVRRKRELVRLLSGLAEKGG